MWNGDFFSNQKYFQKHYKNIIKIFHSFIIREAITRKKSCICKKFKWLCPPPPCIFGILEETFEKNLILDKLKCLKIFVFGHPPHFSLENIQNKWELSSSKCLVIGNPPPPSLEKVQTQEEKFLKKFGFGWDAPPHLHKSFPDTNKNKKFWKNTGLGNELPPFELFPNRRRGS